MSMSTISAQALHQKIRSGEEIDLIDVRTPAEFREVHVEGARNIPLDRLAATDATAGRNGKPLYLICQGGTRGKQACEKLIATGVTNVINVEGGTRAWDQAGLPVVRGKKTISLERQVRIAAGSLVLLGAALGYFINPLFIGLSAFVGAGLIFAGVTDTCGMGMMLAKMPWNQVRESASTSCSAT